ncbi:hypothetical protein DRZ77_00360 [Candidatus Woesearchaeota archaeon]|nr:50S ribosome-binding GTPase [Candidatus Woesearchaeota archaeon]RLE41047.1 MAG: hypothetical protein DRZ77_00360 [Candidatus Woesearchaeota archaeon]
MGFKEIPPVPSVDDLVDIVFKRASKRAKQLKARKKKGRVKESELLRTGIVRDMLITRLDKIVASFPTVDELNVFYKKLVSEFIGIVELKKSLAAVRWARVKINNLFKQINAQMKRVDDSSKLRELRRSFYGRVVSILNQIKEKLLFLENARKRFKGFPTIKALPTVAITGFPNVGKSTLLGKLSESRPKVAAYPFTTKGIMVGYIKVNEQKIQLLDTPGTLNRPNKMNDIEKYAWLAMKYVADKIIYIFDPTEPYSFEEQVNLYRRIAELKKEMLVYVSKCDLISEEKRKQFFKAIEKALGSDACKIYFEEKLKKLASVLSEVKK